MSKDPRHRVPGFPGSSFTRALFVICIAIVAVDSAAAAAWLPAGVPLASTATGQTDLRAVSDGRGGFIAAWIDTLTGVPSIRCQRVDSTGVVQWTPGGVLVRSNGLGVSGLGVVSDGQNGILLAWADTSAVTQAKIRVQRVKADSVAHWTAGGLIVDPTSGDTLQGSPGIASDGAGGAIVAWVENRGATDDDVFVQRILDGGSRAWIAGGVGVDSVDADNQGSPRLLGDGVGGAWVAWEDLSTPVRTFFQRLDGAGAAQWTAGGETPTNATDPSLNAIMARIPGSDSLMVVWSETTPDQIQGSRLDPSGAFAVSGGATLRPSSSMLPVGLVMQTGGPALLVYSSAAQLQTIAITAAGDDTGSPVTLATGQTLDATSNVTVVADGVGGLFVVWASGGGAYAQHLTAAGARDWGATPVSLTSVLTPAQTYPVAVPGFDLLAAWIDGRNAGSTGDDLYMQRVSPSGVTGSYRRILASVAAGTGTFTQNGGRTWVREGDTLRVRFTGSGGQHVDHTVVGATNLGPVPNYTFHNVAGDSTLQAFFSNTAITTQVAAVASAYRAFSVPSTFSNAAVSSVFANLMPYDPVRWRLGHWEADSNRYVEPSSGLATVLPATGYWFIGLKDTTLSFSGTFLPETQYSLPLRRSAGGQGWNQFGLPFTFPVAVSALRLSIGPDSAITVVTNANTDRQILEFNTTTQAYVPVGVLMPGRAYWLWRQTATPVSLRFPYEWSPTAVGSPAPLTLPGADWAIGLTARSGERAASLMFGAAPVAAGRWNGLSTHALPDGPGAGLSLVARVADWGDDNGDYTAVFRPDAEALRWEFDASVPASLTEASLTFAFTNLPAGRRVVLSEPASGWSRDVEAGTTVPLVLSGTSRRLRLEVLAGAPVTPTAPLATALRAVGPNPFRDAATLSFALARGGPLRWDVFDLAGRRVFSGARTLDAGEHVVTWDGRDGAGRRVQPGLYLLRWQADGRSGSARLVRTD